MGRRGPKPKPTELRLLAGNPGKRPLNEREPKPQPGRPPCPRWLHPEAKAEWRRVVPELERLGLLSIVDRAALAVYCQAWARLRDAEAAIDLYGSILKAKASDYIQVSPYVTIARINAQLVRAFGAEFGLSPSARGRMTVVKPRDDDEFENWLNEGNG
jgi:P27 family predicted phage terminase small subunit